MLVDAKVAYEKLVSGKPRYDEKEHCPLIIKIMCDPEKGTMAHFCVEAGISESTFYDWRMAHPNFRKCHEYGKSCARVIWEKLGEEIQHRVYEKGESSNAFEYWRMIGWSRFGVGKNSRIRLNLKPGENPAQHYAQLLEQASEGDFTAGEIKQLMEAVNVGLNAHQVFELQKEIDQLKSDLATLTEMKNGENCYTNKGIA